MTKKKAAKKESAKKQKRAEVMPYNEIPAGDDGRAARVQRGKQEQVDELHSLMSQLDPSLERPVVGGGKAKAEKAKPAQAKGGRDKGGKFVSRRK